MEHELQLTAFVDESGTHGSNSRRTVLGGYVSTNDLWRDFNARWAKLLRIYGVTEVHGIELRTRKGQFKGWTTDKQNRFLNAANVLLERRTKFCFWVDLTNEEYDEHYIRGDRPREMQLDTKYGLCFRQMLSWLSLKLDELFPSQRAILKLVLESGAKNRGDAERIFSLFQKQADPSQTRRISSFGFSDANVPGMQAADLLAYAAFRLFNPQDNAVNFDGTTLSDARQSGPFGPRAPLFRIPLTPKSLRESKQNLIDQIEERKAERARTHIPRSKDTDNPN